jgi:hypothetical protein
MELIRNSLPIGGYSHNKFERSYDDNNHHVMDVNEYLSNRWSWRHDIRLWLVYSIIATVAALILFGMPIALIAFYLVIRYTIFHVNVQREIRGVCSKYSDVVFTTFKDRVNQDKLNYSTWLEKYFREFHYPDDSETFWIWDYTDDGFAEQDKTRFTQVELYTEFRCYLNDFEGSYVGIENYDE